MPNDEQEIQRLDLTHVLVTKTIGDVIYLAPIDTEQPLRVLDVGTGTGIWAIEFGDMHPNAEILGNDLSPIQPAWLPPNVKFEVDDVESPWLHERPFDFIFMRYMCVCILDWPKLTQNIFSSLSSGGWAEFQDFDLQYYSEDGSLTPDHKTLIWINTFLEAAHKMGRDPQPGAKLKGHLEQAGFVNVRHHRYKLPIGPWPKDPHLKDVGLCNLAQILEGLEGFSLRLFCDYLKWTEEEVLVLCAGVRRELKSGTIHAMFDYHVAYGQRP
jgi:SAM-dependent methyltransferase